MQVVYVVHIFPYKKKCWLNKVSFSFVFCILYLVVVVVAIVDVVVFSACIKFWRDFITLVESFAVTFSCNYFVIIFTKTLVGYIDLLAWEMSKTRNNYNNEVWLWVNKVSLSYIFHEIADQCITQRCQYNNKK